jgi:hypothetical protein
MLSFINFSKKSDIYFHKKTFSRSSVCFSVSKMNYSNLVGNSSYIISPQEKIKNSLNTDSSPEKVISELQKNRENYLFFLFCSVNRKHLNYSLLYRLTSLKLRAETEEKTQYQAQFIDEFRKKILENILLIDQPVLQGLVLAEKRLKELVNKENFDYENIIKSFGKKPIEISCFWIVLNAAISAWENKKFFENNISNSEIFSKMKIINQTLIESKIYYSLLPVEIKFLELNFNSRDREITLDDLHIEYIEGLMLLVCQLEKMPSSSYSYFLEKVNSLIKRIFLENFGKEIKNFEHIDIKFELIKLAPLSKLAEIKTLT